VIVYCDDGNRSGKAAAALKGQGFGKAVSLPGGLGAWRQAGLPLEKK
jgi:rhodanese-related sulfurtransferase